MPTEQERPEMFARPTTSSTLKRGPAYSAGTNARAAPRNTLVTVVSNTIEKQMEISEGLKAIPRPRLVGIAGSFDNFQMSVPLPADLQNMPHVRAEQHTPGIHAIKQQHAEPLRSHLIKTDYTDIRALHHQDRTAMLSRGSDRSAASDKIESKVPTVQRADPPIEDRPARIMASSVDSVGWKMVNKGPVILSSTPPPTVRDAELFFDTSSASSSSLIQPIWSRVQTRSPKVSEIASVTESLSADMIDRDEDSFEHKEASPETTRIPDLKPLVLDLPNGPSLHEEIFGSSANEEIKTRVSAERVANKLGDYTRYTGWIERE